MALKLPMHTFYICHNAILIQLYRLEIYSITVTRMHIYTCSHTRTYAQTNTNKYTHVHTHIHPQRYTQRNMQTATSLKLNYHVFA